MTKCNRGYKLHDIPTVLNIVLLGLNVAEPVGNRAIPSSENKK